MSASPRAVARARRHWACLQTPAARWGRGPKVDQEGAKAARSRWPSTPRTWPAPRGRGGRRADGRAVSFPSRLLPAHLLTCRPGPSAWGEGRGVRDAEEERREKEGVQRGLRPPQAARRRSGRYRRQGAATWRSERRRRGFTTTAAPVAAARALAPGGGRRAVRDEAASSRGAGPAVASREDRCRERRGDLRGAP